MQRSQGVRHFSFGQRLFRPSLLLGASLIVGFVSGCGGGASNPNLKELTPTEKNLKAIASLYNQHQQRTGRPPQSLDELKAAARSLSADERKRMGIEDIEKTFVSPRDKQPFVLVVPPKTGFGGPGYMMVPLIVYEKNGEGGMHYVVTPNGSIEEISSEALDTKLTAIRMAEKYGKNPPKPK